MPQGDNLKKCPFCGAAATVTNCAIETYEVSNAGDEFHHEVGCQDCLIVFIGWSDDEIDSAVDKWNTRTLIGDINHA